MTDINPISSEDDLRRQAKENEALQPHPVVPQPAAVENQPSQGFGNENMAKNPEVEPTSRVNISVPGSTRIESRQQTPVSTVLENPEKPFAYRIPAFSYFLAWMFLITAVILGAMASASISSLNTASEYAAKYSSSYGSAAYSSSIQSPDYFKSLMPIFIAIVYCIVMAIGLLRGGRLFRYVGIALSIGAVGYEIYELVQRLYPLLSAYSKYSISIGPMLNTYFVASAIYIPYALLPLVAGIYLLTPKANEAYK